MPDAQAEYHVLAVEDNPGDAMLIKHAWAECEVVRASVIILPESKDVVQYLRRGGPYSQQSDPTPDLIMLDYVMPVNGGIALAQLKNDPDLLVIPVVVLTGSPNPQNLAEVYKRHANCCFAKPSTLQEFVDLTCYLAEFWLKRVRRPPKPPV
jgi:two-component system response regulator